MFSFTISKCAQWAHHGCFVWVMQTNHQQVSLFFLLFTFSHHILTTWCCLIYMFFSKRPNSGDNWCINSKVPPKNYVYLDSDMLRLNLIFLNLVWPNRSFSLQHANTDEWHYVWPYHCQNLVYLLNDTDSIKSQDIQWTRHGSLLCNLRLIILQSKQ